MNTYQEYLADLHSKLVTPDEIIFDAVKEAVNLPVQEKKRIIAGEASEVYDIGLEGGGHVIMRISRSDQPQYEQEKWAFEQCKKVGGIPIPEILLIKHIPTKEQILSICIQNKLPGDTLERGNIDFGKFEINRRRKIINKAGEILSKIHTIEPHGFGYLRVGGVGPKSSFKELTSEHLEKEEEFLKLAREINLPEETMQRAFEVLTEKAANTPEIMPALNHGDFNVKHIMVDENDEITGIIDWGDIEGNSPVNDFAKWDYWFNDYIPTEWLKEGYANKALFNDQFEDFLHWIKLNTGLGVLWWYHQTRYPQAVEKARKKLLKDLEFYQ